MFFLVALEGPVSPGHRLLDGMNLGFFDEMLHSHGRRKVLGAVRTIVRIHEMEISMGRQVLDPSLLP